MKNTRQKHIALAQVFLTALLGWTSAGWSSEETGPEGAEAESGTDVELAQATPLYRTREERRDAGPKTELWPGVSVSGLLEIELLRDSLRPTEGENRTDRSEAVAIELTLLMAFNQYAGLEAVIEYDSSGDRVEADELFVALEQEDWEWSFGRQYTPLGEFQSSFITGPLIEFGETRSDVVIAADYSPEDHMEFAMSLYHGAARSAEAGSAADWAAAATFRWFEDWTFGLSYQSDLADSDERLLEDEDDQFDRKVPAASAYLQWQSERVEVSVELLGALRDFVELETDRNRPQAWNFELLYLLPEYETALAFRYEGSDELQDAPQTRFGISANWRFSRYGEITIEYLRADYAAGFAETKDGRSVTQANQFGARFSLAF